MTSTSTPAAAHPRSRGEHANSLFIFPRPPGSSPLARGTFLGVFSVIIEFRLIPARAGNIMNVQFSPGALTAHPRSRGEHMGWLSSIGLGCGSSPLARGTWGVRRCRLRLLRLIPARAGNIQSTRSCPCLPPAHPRSRGEHDRFEAVASRVIGSSPLARGTF